jgi:hypothetical protein
MKLAALALIAVVLGNTSVAYGSNASASLQFEQHLVSESRHADIVNSEEQQQTVIRWDLQPCIEVYL